MTVSEFWLAIYGIGELVRKVLIGISYGVANQRSNKRGCRSPSEDRIQYDVSGFILAFSLSRSSAFRMNWLSCSDFHCSDEILWFIRLSGVLIMQRSTLTTSILKCTWSRACTSSIIFSLVFSRLFFRLCNRLRTLALLIRSFSRL